MNKNITIFFDRYIWTPLWRLCLSNIYGRHIMSYRKKKYARIVRLIDRIDAWHLDRIERLCPDYGG